MQISQRLAACSSKCAGSLDDIFYLPAIDSPFAKILNLCFRDTQIILTLRGDLLEECDPNLASRVRLEVVVAQGDMDTGLESLVECLHPVRGQEEDALEVSREWVLETEILKEKS